MFPFKLLLSPGQTLYIFSWTLQSDIFSQRGLVVPSKCFVSNTPFIKGHQVTKKKSLVKRSKRNFWEHAVLNACLFSGIIIH